MAKASAVEREMQKLIKRTSQAVEQKKKKERPSYDPSIVRSPAAVNQEDIDDQFNHMKRREF